MGIWEPALLAHVLANAKCRMKGIRRQSELPPGTALREWPLGVPLIWDARLALARLWQLYRRMVQAPTLPDGFRWRSQPMPTMIRELAWGAAIKVGPRPNRVVTVCPRCRAEAYLLRATPDGWACRRCDPRHWRQLEVSVGAYAMGLMIGVTGRPMVRRRQRIMNALWSLTLRVRSIRQLALIGAGAELLRYSPHWRRRPGGTRAGAADHGPGPLTRKFGSLYVQVVIEEVLHPRAFRQRFVVV